MPATPDFQQYQFAFAANIRDPRANPMPPGVPTKRMKIYQELLFNNLESFLLACYPVLRKILGKRRWTTMVRSFFAQHRCRSPLFRQIAEEFLHYLTKERETLPDDPPFLLELAHYEWLELALSISELEGDHAGLDPAGDLLDGVPVLNPVLALAAYQFPVHRIGPRFKPATADASPTLLAVFRDAACKVRFILLNPASHRLLKILSESPSSGRDALQQIARELQHPHPDQVIEGGRDILTSLRQEDIILGTRTTI